MYPNDLTLLLSTLIYWVSSKTKVDETEIESAKSCMTFDVAKKEATVGEAARISFVNQALLGVPRDYNLKILEQAEVLSLILPDAKSYLVADVSAYSR
jgi:hypothetical protein